MQFHVILRNIVLSWGLYFACSVGYQFQNKAISPSDCSTLLQSLILSYNDPRLREGGVGVYDITPPPFTVSN